MRRGPAAAPRKEKAVMVRYGFWDTEAFEHFQVRAGLTHEALAKKSRVSPSTIQKLAIGERAPSWENLQSIAEALGVSPADLVTPPGAAFERVPIADGQIARRRELLREAERLVDKLRREERRELQDWGTESIRSSDH